MRSGIVYYILLLLDANDAVNVPLVGRLNKRVYPAKTDLDAREVHPPHATIQFSRNDGDGDHLLQQYIAHAAGISEVDAERQIEAFSNELKTELETNGRAAIDYLGVFYKRGEDVLFEPDHRTAALGYAGLKKVALPKPAPLAAAGAMSSAAEARAAVAVAASAETVTLPEPEPEPDVSDQPKPQTAGSTFRPIDSRVAWLVGLFGIVFILVAALAVYNYTSREKEQYPASAFNRAPMPEPMITPTSDDTMPDTNSAEPLPGEETVNQPETITDTDSIGSAEQLAWDEGYTDSLSGEESKAGEEYISTSEEEVRPEVESASKATTEAGNLRECHVVVGAFGVNSNVERMMKRLQALGYQVDTMPKGSLTQVGVPAPCGTAEIDRLLNELRAEIEAQAWILNK